MQLFACVIVKRVPSTGGVVKKTFHRVGTNLVFGCTTGVGWEDQGLGVGCWQRQHVNISLKYYQTFVLLS